MSGAQLIALALLVVVTHIGAWAAGLWVGYFVLREPERRPPAGNT